MNLRLLGSIFLVLATSIGAALLALPIATAIGGFKYACLLLFICWASMTLGAFYILEVNLKLPVNSNLISMAKQSLGLWGQCAAWLTYLLLLYSLISAYLAGGTDIVSSINAIFHIALPTQINTLIFLLVLGTIVCKGIHAVDWTNRVLMITKLAIFFLLSTIASTHVAKQNFGVGTFGHLLPATMVVITSFGFAIIIPSLRVYLKSNAKELQLSLMIGSFFALLCYFFWIFVVQGIIPHHRLIVLAKSPAIISGLTLALSEKLNTPIVVSFIHLFTSICIMTAFLAVSLSLSDFLADGWQIQKKGKHAVFIFALTFLPPLLITLYCPGIFIMALRYAGIFCVLLLVLLPSLMAWRMRQIKPTADYQVWGGQPLLLISALLGFILFLVGICTI